ncbi:MAG: hypothetical protein RL173_3703, partial [Fibrobacterota bacterium]
MVWFVSESGGEGRSSEWSVTARIGQFAERR